MLALACVTLTAIFLFLIVVTLAAHRLAYSDVPWTEVAKYPGVIVLSQLLAYILVFSLMYFLDYSLDNLSMMADACAAPQKHLFWAWLPVFFSQRWPSP